MATAFFYKPHCTDPGSQARRGTFQTPHGPVEMPAFMPVGTLASVKGLDIERVRQTGAQMVLSNTYHLALRPGEAVVQKHGGLHRFMGWDGPILTDSGGFQVFSLAQNTQVSEQCAVFRSHLDGNLFELSPERAVRIQEALGSDIAMVLDHVIALPGSIDAIRDATERSMRWAARCRDAHRRADQVQFGIVQGGLDADLRVRCAEELVRLNFPGYAVGGLSVGESPEEMYRVLDATVPALPTDRPRYLMGVGRPEDLLAAIARGIDLFDCVLPTRNGRNALAYTSRGTLRLRNKQYELDELPIEEGCPCIACKHSRGYLRHLFLANEMLGPVLLSAHNLTNYQRLLADARAAIERGCFRQFADSALLAMGAGQSSLGNCE
jgi:queuine tRNA-ribosyltransferase